MYTFVDSRVLSVWLARLGCKEGKTGRATLKVGNKNGGFEITLSSIDRDIRTWTSNSTSTGDAFSGLLAAACAELAKETLAVQCDIEVFGRHFINVRTAIESGLDPVDPIFEKHLDSTCQQIAYAIAMEIVCLESGIANPERLGWSRVGTKGIYRPIEDMRRCNCIGLGNWPPEPGTHAGVFCTANYSLGWHYTTIDLPRSAVESLAGQSGPLWDFLRMDAICLSYSSALDSITRRVQNLIASAAGGERTPSNTLRLFSLEVAMLSSASEVLLGYLSNEHQEYLKKYEATNDFDRRFRLAMELELRVARMTEQASAAESKAKQDRIAWLLFVVSMLSIVSAFKNANDLTRASPLWLTVAIALVVIATLHWYTSFRSKGRREAKGEGRDPK